jgi:hypothetical protein
MQSLNESDHCKVTILVLSMGDANILSSVNDQNRFWRLILDLILSTDVVRFFDFLKQWKSMEIWNSNENGRKLMLVLLLKCAEMCSMVKSIETLHDRFDIVSNDFFDKGDIEKVDGLVFCEKEKGREGLDRQLSKVGFLKGVCRPVFECLCRVFPNLKYLLDQLDSNIGALSK